MQQEGTLWDLREGLPLVDDYIYLNTGFIGPQTAVSQRAAAEARALAWQQGLTTQAGFEASRERMAAARAAIAESLEAPPECIALTGCTSDGIRLVVGGLRWQPGDVVVTNSLEHHAGYLPAYWLREARGVEYRIAQVPPAADPGTVLEAFRAVMDQRVRLVILSPVTFTGLAYPVPALLDLFRQHGALVLLDAAQAYGQIPLSVRDWDADFVAIPGQKWALGPEGTGALYVSPRWIDELDVIPVGGAGFEQHGPDGTAIRKRGLAVRFETSTLPVPEVVGFHASIGLFAAIGRDVIARRIQALADRVRAGLAMIDGVRVVSPLDGPGRCGMVSFQVDGVGAPDVVALLLRSRVVCRKIPALDAVRFSLGPFLTDAEIEEAVGAVARIARAQGAAARGGGS